MRQSIIFFSGNYNKFFFAQQQVKGKLPVLLKLFWVFIFFNIITGVHAQNNNADTTSVSLQTADSLSKIHIRRILIFGNKKTKDYVILREMPFRTGDSVITSHLSNELKKAHEYIYNTRLFLEVTISPLPIDEHNLDILVMLKERWYIFPIPYVELADRSFNEWVEKYNASFKRLSYGVMFSHFNISGRRDRLSLTLVNGFKKHVSVEYSAPYINSSLRDGLRFGSGYTQTREIPYRTDYHNHLVYFRNNHFVKNEWYATGAYTSRKGIKRKASFITTFRHVEVSDSITSHYNNRYFNSNSSAQNFVDLEYQLEMNDVDDIGYPLKGHTYLLSLKKRGFGLSGGINQFSVGATFNKYFSYPNQWYSSIRLSGEIKLPFTQPYYNQKALGYQENYLRGDEYFVIDGVAFGLSKFDVKKRISHFNLPTFINSKTYNKIPFTLYLKSYVDLGYFYGQEEFDTRLNNRFLYSGGFGLDIVTLYDLKLSIEYNINQLGQKGLFLHR